MKPSLLLAVCFTAIAISMLIHSECVLPNGSIWCSHYDYSDQYIGKDPEKKASSTSEDHECEVCTPGGLWCHDGDCGDPSACVTCGQPYNP